MTNIWDKVQELFQQALDLPEDRRRAFVESAAGSDIELFKEVMSLLDAYSSGDVLSGNAFDSVSRVPEEGASVGAYRLVRRIGVGGMGSVFLAERADGTFEQSVAVKLVKRGMDSEMVVERFRLERQVLARLEHPNIARLIDGGVTDDGRPFFVMEYVEGQPITEYCDSNRLTVDDRLSLFSDVCKAVHHAHRNLVVHRDLKPSNILVTPDGVVKLLDFGIAKLLDDSEDAALTRTGQHVLTPAYASPEQIAAKPITTSSDVFSLGVILYQLLSGRRPFESTRSRAELEKMVLTADPERPSTAILQTLVPDDLDTEPVTPDTVSESRGTRIDKLRRRLAGDLDKICLMALRKEPERRYPSALDLADDILRHQEGLTVYAQPDSLSYRARKFVRRNTVGVAITAAAFVVFLATVAFYTNRLANERDFALAEQAKTAEVVEFITGLFEYADPELSQGRDLTVRELLDQGAVDVGSELSSQPAIQRTLERVLGEVYYGIGDLDKADSLLSLALEKSVDENSVDILDLARIQIALGIVYQDRGDVQTADSLYNLSLENRRSMLPDVHEDIAEGLAVIAFLKETEGQYAAAESLFTEALRINRVLADGEPTTRVAESLENMAGLYRVLDRADEAEPLLLEALELQHELYGGEDLEIAETEKELAGLYRDTERYAEAESLYIKVLETRTRMLGETHVEVAHTWNSYSTLLSNMGRTDEAIEANKRLVEILRINFDGPHPSLAASYNNLAIMLRDNDDYEQAEDYFRRSIAMQDSTGLPEDHPNRAFPLQGLATNFRIAGRYQDAIDVLEGVLVLRRDALTSEHRHTMDTASDLALNYLELGRFSEAEPLFLEAYTYFNEVRGEDDYRTQRTARRLARLYTETGNESLALEFEEAAGS